MHYLYLTEFKHKLEGKQQEELASGRFDRHFQLEAYTSGPKGKFDDQQRLRLKKLYLAYVSFASVPTFEERLDNFFRQLGTNFFHVVMPLPPSLLRRQFFVIDPSGTAKIPVSWVQIHKYEPNAGKTLDKKHSIPSFTSMPCKLLVNRLPTGREHFWSPSEFDSPFYQSY